MKALSPAYIGYLLYQALIGAKPYADDKHAYSLLIWEARLLPGVRCSHNIAADPDRPA